MRVYKGFNPTQEKLLNPNELLEIVNGYKGILSPEIIEYLNSLIGLEFSALREDLLSSQAMQKLTELDLYRKILIYNIYNRAVNIFAKEGSYLKQEGIENGTKSLTISGTDGKENRFEVFNFSFKDKTNQINLYNTIFDAIKRNRQIEELYEEWQQLEEESAPMMMGWSWSQRHKADKETKVKAIIDSITELENRNKYIEETEYVADIQKYFSELILKDYGLILQRDFEQDNTITASDVLSSTVNYEVDKAMTKKLVKTYPHTTVSQNIKYY